MLPAIIGALGRVAGVAGSALEGVGAAGATGAEGGAISRLFKGALGGGGAGGKAEELAEKATKVGHAISTVAGHFGQLAYASQAAGGAISGLTKLMVPMAPLVKGIVGGLNLFVGAVTSIGDSVAGFVALSSPVHVQKFKLATDDLMATIGHMLLPVMEYGTELVRTFADVLSTLSGPMQKLTHAVFDPLLKAIPKLLTIFSPVIEIFGTFISLLADALAPVMKVMVPVVEGFTVVLAALAAPTVIPVVVGLVGVLVSGFVALTATLGPVIVVLAAVGYAFQEAIAYLSKALGIKSVAGKSVGAAARPATFSSVEDYGRKAQQAAFSLGTGADPAKESALTLKSIYDFLIKIIADIREWINNLPEKIGDAVVRALPNRKDVVKTAAKYGAFGPGGVLAAAAADFFRGSS